MKAKLFLDGKEIGKCTSATFHKVCTLQPIKDWVLIEPDKQEAVGTIIVPDSFKEDSGYGTVIAVGPGLKGEPIELRPGDRVTWDKLYGAGFRFDYEGREIIALHYKDIFGTV